MSLPLVIAGWFSCHSTASEKDPYLKRYVVAIKTPAYVAETLNYYDVAEIKISGGGPITEIHPDSCRFSTCYSSRNDKVCPIAHAEITWFERYLEVISAACCKLAHIGIVDDQLLKELKEEGTLLANCDLEVVTKQVDGRIVTRCYPSPYMDRSDLNDSDYTSRGWNPVGDTDYLVTLLLTAQRRLKCLFYKI